jgi:hypothetical protein
LLGLVLLEPPLRNIPISAGPGADNTTDNP